MTIYNNNNSLGPSRPKWPDEQLITRKCIEHLLAPPLQPIDSYYSKAVSRQADRVGRARLLASSCCGSCRSGPDRGAWPDQQPAWLLAKSGDRERQCLIISCCRGCWSGLKTGLEREAGPDKQLLWLLARPGERQGQGLISRCCGGCGSCLEIGSKRETAVSGAVLYFPEEPMAA